MREGLNLARHRGSSVSLDNKTGKWQLDHIVNSKVFGPHHILYLVRWVGYAPTDDTWEPTEHVPPDVFEELEAVQARKAAAVEEKKKRRRPLRRRSRSSRCARLSVV